MFGAELPLIVYDFPSEWIKPEIHVAAGDRSLALPCPGKRHGITYENRMKKRSKVRLISGPKLCLIVRLVFGLELGWGLVTNGGVFAVVIVVGFGDVENLDASVGIVDEAFCS